MHDRPRTALGQLDASHRRHDERLTGLIAVAEQLCGGHGGPQDLEDLEEAVVWFARSVPRHFGDEDDVVFPALAAARPDLAAALAALSAEHAGLLAAHAAVHDAVMSWQGREPVGGALASFLAAVHDVAARYRAHAAREDALFADLGDAVFDSEADGRMLAAMDERRGHRGSR